MTLNMNSRNKTIACLWSLALAGTPAVYAQTPRSPVAPTVACSLLFDDPAAQSGPPIKISNLKRVFVRATLVGLQNSLDSVRLANPTASGRDAAQPMLDVVVRRTTDSGHRRVETRAIETGRGSRPGEQYIDIALEIPIDHAARRANIERYLDWIGQESAKVGKSNQFSRLTRDREAAIATFERLYMENSIGDFEVSCAYSAQVGLSTAVIESAPPLKLQVFFESSFFDQRTFR